MSRIGPHHRGMCFNPNASSQRNPDGSLTFPQTHFTDVWEHVTCSVCLANWVPNDVQHASKEERDRALRPQVLGDEAEALERGRRLIELRKKVAELPPSAHEKNEQGYRPK